MRSIRCVLYGPEESLDAQQYGKTMVQTFLRLIVRLSRTNHFNQSSLNAPFDQHTASDNREAVEL